MGNYARRRRRHPLDYHLLTDEDGLELPRDVQPSLNALTYVGNLFIYKGFIQRKLHFFWVNRLSLPTADRQKYLYGRTWTSTFFTSWAMNLHWSLIGQLRSEWRTTDSWNEVDIVSTGGKTVYFAPQINYNLAQTWNISALVDIPLWRDLNGSQLGKTWALTMAVNRTFKKASPRLVK
jgi:hypothetical protein